MGVDGVLGIFVTVVLTAGLAHATDNPSPVLAWKQAAFYETCPTADYFPSSDKMRCSHMVNHPSTPTVFALCFCGSSNGECGTKSSLWTGGNDDLAIYRFYTDPVTTPLPTCHFGRSFGSDQDELAAGLVFTPYSPDGVDLVIAYARTNGDFTGADDNTNIQYGGYDTVLFALNADTGAEAWAFQMGSSEDEIATGLHQAEQDEAAVVYATGMTYGDIRTNGPLGGEGQSFFCQFTYTSTSITRSWCVQKSQPAAATGCVDSTAAYDWATGSFYVAALKGTELIMKKYSRQDADVTYEWTMTVDGANSVYYLKDTMFIRSGYAYIISITIVSSSYYPTVYKAPLAGSGSVSSYNARYSCRHYDPTLTEIISSLSHDENGLYAGFVMTGTASSSHFPSALWTEFGGVKSQIFFKLDFDLVERFMYCLGQDAWDRPGIMHSARDKLLVSAYLYSTALSYQTNPSGTSFQYSANMLALQPSLCSPGQYSYSIGSCASCLPGTYTNYTNAVSCLPCAKGSATSDTGRATECDLCGAGHYANWTGMAACNACEPGSYQSLSGQSTCTPCAAGTAAADYARTSGCAECLPGYYSSQGQAHCSICAPGYISKVNASESCSPCGFGQYSDASGGIECKDCPLDTYADERGMSSCKACPDMMTTQFERSDTKALCLCPDGHYDLDGVCKRCKTGTDCDRGTVTPQAIYGYYVSSMKKESVYRCSPPEACKGGVDSCSPGYTGESGCTECSAGLYRQNGQCIDCPFGVTADLKSYLFYIIAFSMSGFYIAFFTVAFCAVCGTRIVDSSGSWKAAQAAGDLRIGVSAESANEGITTRLSRAAAVTMYYLQHAVILTRLPTHWPAWWLQLWSFVDFVSLDFLGVFPYECLFNLDQARILVRYYVEFSWAPVVVVFTLLACGVLALTQFVPACRSGCVAKALTSALAVEMQLAVSLYAVLCGVFFSAFHCYPEETDEAGARWRFALNPEHICYDFTDPLTSARLPRALTFGLFFVAGVPLIAAMGIAFSLRRPHHAIAQGIFRFLTSPYNDGFRYYSLFTLFIQLMVTGSVLLVGLGWGEQVAFLTALYLVVLVHGSTRQVYRSPKLRRAVLSRDFSIWTIAITAGTLYRSDIASPLIDMYMAGLLAVAAVFLVCLMVYVLAGTRPTRGGTPAGDPGIAATDEKSTIGLMQPTNDT